MSLTSHSPAMTAVASAASDVSRANGTVLDHRVLDGAVWDRAVSGFDGVCQEQLYAYASLRWPGVALEPVLFSDGDDGA
ncbi:hypothetical protein [Pelagibacterium halotolerans]|uniref:hypothetical protein n=1 Tax=Pelagibacterium halotolerans TaxID=531813 RepID=UPI0005A02882|nr:hypothetical protein [Pelagibacterium halotolerans]